MANTLTAERLKELLEYDENTGKFTWISVNSNRVKIGDIAGTVNNHGYRVTTVDGKKNQEHRLVWLYTYGNFPDKFIDHIDGDRANNLLSNLRECSIIENARNVKIMDTNTSGFKGVSYSERDGTYSAYLTSGGKCKNLGARSTPEEASLLYEAAAKELHGKFYRDTTKRGCSLGNKEKTNSFD